MATDFKKAADEFLKTAAGSKIDKKELGKIMGSEDGQKIKNMIEQGDTDLMDAVRKGDMDTLRNTLAGVLQTEEGARLADRIMKMMK